MDENLIAVLAKAERLRTQQPQDSNKLYSWHEPDVRCISKGKARQRYEFGQKVAVATTNRSHWFVGAKLFENNPYDGHTLRETLQAVKRVTNAPITDAYVDKGYRGHKCKGVTRVHIAGLGSRNVPRSEKRRRKRRSAIEPKIGHLKSDHRVRRCFLTGIEGDAINIVLAAAAANLRKLLRRLSFARIAEHWYPRAVRLMSRVQRFAGCIGHAALANRMTVSRAPIWTAAA